MFAARLPPMRRLPRPQIRRTLALNVPTMIVCLVAGFVILGRWQEAPRASFWAALGFGVVLVFCFVLPLAHTMLQHWVLDSGERASRMWAFTALSVAASVLHAVVYVLLLTAIYAGRGSEARIED
jgi:hypothetical protein